jgi:hypothetical protein
MPSLGLESTIPASERAKKVHALDRSATETGPQKFMFCNLVLKSMHDGFTYSQLLFITDEAYFHLRGYVTSQNTRIWIEESPYAVHQVP